MAQSTRLFSRSMGRWLMALMLVMLSSLATRAAEAYACYTSSNTTLTFYYDNLRASRTGTTYDLNTDSNITGWETSGTNTDVTRVVFDSSFANARPTTTYSWFYGMENLQSITGISYLKTSAVTNMSWMFGLCENLTSLDLRGFNTANVTDMWGMFQGCYRLPSLDVSSFNTAKVTDMSNMFKNCSNLTTIYAGSGWSTAAVTSSYSMFENCTSLVGGKGTTYNANHTDKAYAHIDGGTSNPGYLTDPNVLTAYACYTPSNTTLTFYYDNKRYSRTGTTYDLNTDGSDTGWETDGTNANVTKVVFYPSFASARPTTTYSWFYGMENLQSITGISYLNTSAVTNMSWMFGLCENLTSLDLSGFNTANVIDMWGMFSGCSSLTSLSVRNFNTAKVVQIRNIFYNCEKLTSLDLSSFNTAKVTEMTSMFNGCSNLTTIYVGSGWSTAAVTDSYYMFENCTSLVGGKGTTYNSNHTDKAYAHIDGGTSNPGYFTRDPNSPEAYACYTPSNTTLTFYYDNLRYSRPGTTYDLNTGYNTPGWETDGTNQSVTNIIVDYSFVGTRPTTTYHWFYEMRNLTNIPNVNISYLNTSEVTNMKGMFAFCSKLSFLGSINFNTSKVTDMDDMFMACDNLTSLDLSNFNTSKVTYMRNMFQGCENLMLIYVGSGWTTAAVTKSSDMFLNCIRLSGGRGTRYSLSNPMDKTYAHIDYGPSNPGYFTDKNGGLRGDVNGNGIVNISDVTDLISLLLGNGTISNQAADCNQDSNVNISDVTALISYLLSGTW